MLARGKGLANLSAQRIWFRQSSLAAQRDRHDTACDNPAEQLGRPR